MEDFDLNENYTGAVLKKPNGREVWVIIGVKGGKNVIYLASTDSDNYYFNSNVCYEVSLNCKISLAKRTPQNRLAKPTRFKLVTRYLPLQTLQLYFRKRQIGYLDEKEVLNLCQKLELLNPK